ncbi:MAG: hypothetical protein ACJ78Q_08040 [Chloroflexia bacterium]
MKCGKTVGPTALVVLLSLILSGCLFESPTPSPIVPTPTASSGPTPAGGRVRYGCEDAWYLEPSSVPAKINQAEAEKRMRAFFEERGPHKAMELLEVHYGTWIQGDEEESEARETPGATPTGARVVWLLVFRWLPQPGPENTPPPGYANRLHGIVDTQTGEPVVGCASMMKVSLLRNHQPHSHALAGSIRPLL